MAMNVLLESFHESPIWHSQSFFFIVIQSSYLLFGNENYFESSSCPIHYHVDDLTFDKITLLPFEPLADLPTVNDKVNQISDWEKGI